MYSKCLGTWIWDGQWLGWAGCTNTPQISMFNTCSRLHLILMIPSVVPVCFNDRDISHRLLRTGNQGTCIGVKDESFTIITGNVFCQYCLCSIVYSAPSVLLYSSLASFDAVHPSFHAIDSNSAQPSPAFQQSLPYA
jgi:hypothetical protein